MTVKKPLRKRKKWVKSARAKAGTRRPRSKFLKDGTVREAFIQAEILAWLGTTTYMFWRQNSGVMYKCGRKIFLGPPGCADISFIGPCGRMCGLEVKSANGKPNEDQIAYAWSLTAAGGLYFIVRTLQQAMDAVAEIIGATV
mgnify:CR=1 FL=1